MKKIHGSAIIRIWNNFNSNEGWQFIKLGPDEIVLVFENCEIEGNVTLRGRPTNQDSKPVALRFVNCQIESIALESVSGLRSLQFISSKVNRLDITNGVFGDIYFNECSDITYVRISNKSNIGQILTNRMSVIRDLLIQESKTGHIWFDGESEFGDINIETTNSIQFIIVRNSKGLNVTLSKETKYGRIEVTKSKLKSLLINSQSACGDITIEESQIEKGIEILNSVSERIHVHNSYIENVLVAEQSNVMSVYLRTTKGGWIRVGNSIVTDIEIAAQSHLLGVELVHLKKECLRLNISNSGLYSVVTQLNNPYSIGITQSYIMSLYLTKGSFPKESFLTVSDTMINRLRIESYVNQGFIAFSNIIPKTKADLDVFIEPDLYKNVEPGSERKSLINDDRGNSQLAIVNSDLGKTNFIGCDLNSFDEFTFANSKLLEVFIADTILPKRTRISTVEEKNIGYSLLEQRRLALSQFKKIYENRGDIVNAIEYHAQEMETYRMCLRVVEINSRTEWWNNRSERFNLWLNRHSSNYGNNWLRAVVFTLGLNWTLFAIYCMALGYKPGDDWSLFWRLFSYSFEFLNPLRKADFIKEATTNTGGRIIDYISRILLAYFVYQTIQAFRKFGKKSV